MQAPMTIKQYVSQMRKIPGGRFTMGRTYKVKDERWVEAEVPAHPVEISPFRMGATPVTVGMWREYVRANGNLSMPSLPKWDWIDDHPVVNVTWNDIMGDDGRGGYCAWASRVCGTKLTLPTEARWEYVAKCGGNEIRPWGNKFDPNKLWCATANEKVLKTAPVVRSNRVFINTWGCSDLIGNVMQWCSDWYGPYSVPTRDRLGYMELSRNPEGAKSGSSRPVRGTAWSTDIEDWARSTFRIHSVQSLRDDNYGFRLVAPA
jgi:sulfatase modifying factor 1